uniref:Uncharacterized protein n=1 Tax=Aureoumbra lagunensis TaxID=44058 RepID=A0A7S3JRB4_9STRA|mmetsp:Transcript_17496/g.22806  ORF Transcript_17496/g.22806 Transcript_17496/m.22806 type:complete len:311 (-) Transcript_17496:89-1021(-)
MFWLCFAICLPNVVWSGERRSKLEALLKHVTRLEAIESKLEEAMLDRIARARVRGKSHQLSKENQTVQIFMPELRGLPNAAILSTLYVSNETINRLTLRTYLASQKESTIARKPLTKTKKKFASSASSHRRRDDTTIFLFFGEQPQLNWSSGGFSLFGRLIGIPLIPFRFVYEIIRIVLIRILYLIALDSTSQIAVQTLDIVLRQGPFKAIPRLIPALDFARSSRYAVYYNFFLRYTASPRRALRLAWRTPADLGRTLYAHAIKQWYLRERHQRLEAVLLRAAASETKRYLELLRPLRRQLKSIDKGSEL